MSTTTGGQGRAAKAEIRKRVKGELRSLTAEEIEGQSAEATKALLEMPEYQNCHSISIFMSMPQRELQTAQIMKDSLQAGKRVYVPYIYSASSDGRSEQSVMDMFQLINEEDLSSLKPDKWGIPSLHSDNVEGRSNSFGGKGRTAGKYDSSKGNELDLVLMPAVAFDAAFNRLGHGKGYYDSFLARCSSSTMPFLVGLSLANQMLPEPTRLPVELWDKPVDAIVCAGHIFRRTPSAAHA